MQATLFVVLLYLGQSVAWDNDFDKQLYKVCDAGSSFYRVRSEHDDWTEDRRYLFDCKENQVSGSCYWTDYVNHFDQLMNFRCNPNYVVTGVNSYHSDWHEDRRFSFRCCKMRYANLGYCHVTPIINAWNAYMDYTVPSDSVIRGFKSWHHDWHQDRQWQVFICRKE